MYNNREHCGVGYNGGLTGVCRDNVRCYCCGWVCPTSV